MSFVAHAQKQIKSKKQMRMKVAFSATPPSDSTIFPANYNTATDFDGEMTVTCTPFASSAELWAYLKNNSFEVGAITIDTDDADNLDNQFDLTQITPGADNALQGVIDWREYRRESSSGDYLKRAVLPPSEGFIHNGRKNISLENTTASTFIEFLIDVSGWDWSPALAPIQNDIQ